MRHFERAPFYYEKKQTVHAKDGKKINVAAVILFLLIFLIFLAAEGMIAVYLGVM